MGLNEDVQEALKNIIQYSMDLIGNIMQVLDDSFDSIRITKDSFEDDRVEFMSPPKKHRK